MANLEHTPWVERAGYTLKRVSETRTQPRDNFFKLRKESTMRARSSSYPERKNWRTLIDNNLKAIGNLEDAHHHIRSALTQNSTGNALVLQVQKMALQARETHNELNKRVSFSTRLKSERHKQEDEKYKFVQLSKRLAAKKTPDRPLSPQEQMQLAQCREVIERIDKSIALTLKKSEVCADETKVFEAMLMQQLRALNEYVTPQGERESEGETIHEDEGEGEGEGEGPCIRRPGY